MELIKELVINLFIQVMDMGVVVFPKIIAAINKNYDNHGYQSELIYLLKKLTIKQKCFIQEN